MCSLYTIKSATQLCGVWFIFQLSSVVNVWLAWRTPLSTILGCHYVLFWGYIHTSYNLINEGIEWLQNKYCAVNVCFVGAQNKG